MREDINALGSSAQDVNVKKCTHFAPRVVKVGSSFLTLGYNETFPSEL